MASPILARCFGSPVFRPRSRFGNVYQATFFLDNTIV